MKLVYKFSYNGMHNNLLLSYCITSKNLYNQSLYYIKNILQKEGRFVSYTELDRAMKTIVNLDKQINYRLMPKAQASQQCLKMLNEDIRSYIKSIKDWSQNKNKYNKKPQFPNYKKHTNIIVLPNQSCQIKDGYLYINKQCSIKIPQWEKYKEYISNFQQVRIIPKSNGSCFIIEIIYNKNIENKKLDINLYSSIDLGVDNLVTFVTDKKVLLYSGKQIKAINQFFNKKISKLRSNLELCNKQKTSKQITRICQRRNNKINDLMHKVSKHIVQYSIENKIGNIVVGYNKGWKDSINIGRRNNQTFVSIPYYKLINCIKYKCKLCGINFILTEESYTSKCDAIQLEEIRKHKEYSGKRIKRGMFQSKGNKMINADVNGALNIMRKVVGDSEIISKIINSGLLFNPIKINDLYHLF